MYTGLDWIVQDDTVVRPDIVVVCGRQPEQYLDCAPNIAVEVLSPSTADKDLGPKRDLYQQQGVPHYLIIDPASNELRWLQLQAGQYEQQPFSGALNMPLNDNCMLRIEWP